MYDHTKVKVVIKIITSNENVYCTVGFVTLGNSQWFPWQDVSSAIQWVHLLI